MIYLGTTKLQLLNSTIKEAQNADTLDGKHADEFATPEYVDNAIADIKSGLDFLPPKHLRDAHYKDASKYGHGEGYVYTHSNPNYIQQFMPDEIKDKKYFEI